MNYQEIEALLTPGGVLTFAYCKTAVHPWRVTFRGQGRYFSNADALSGYAAGRGWISISQVDMLAGALKSLISGIMVDEREVK